MSEADDLDKIREKKRQELLDKLGEGEEPTAEADDAAPAAPDSPVQIESDQHFQEVTGEYEVVVVDFYADWCGPCKMVEPIMDQIAAETDAAVAKVDIDRLQRLAQQHGVRGVPTMMVYADGEPAERMVGVQDKSTIAGLVDRYGS